LKKEIEKTENNLQLYAEMNKNLEKEIKSKQDVLTKNNNTQIMQVRRQSRFASPSQNKNESFGSSSKNSPNEGRESMNMRKSFMST
jgi:hypothetical protein